MSIEYPSIKNLFASSADHKTRGPQFGFSEPAFRQIGRWLVTEKVDGTNIRVILENDPGSRGPDPEPLSQSLRIAGRTDNAQLHPQLIEHLQQAFTLEKMWDVFKRDESTDVAQPEHWVCPDVILFGEGFGPGIQKAGVAYGGEKRFTLFDVLVDNRWWLRWDDVVDVAQKLGVPHVPCLGRDRNLESAMGLVQHSALLPQAYGDDHVEGVVLRTDPYLFDGRGHRVVAKYKVRDL